MMFAVQRFIFENTPHPAWAALLSGFGVMLFGKMYITSAGEAYLTGEKHA